MLSGTSVCLRCVTMSLLRVVAATHPREMCLPRGENTINHRARAHSGLLTMDNGSPCRLLSTDSRATGQSSAPQPVRVLLHECVGVDWCKALFASQTRALHWFRCMKPRSHVMSPRR